MLNPVCSFRGPKCEVVVNIAGSYMYIVCDSAFRRNRISELNEVQLVSMDSTPNLVGRWAALHAGFEEMKQQGALQSQKEFQLTCRMLQHKSCASIIDKSKLHTFGSGV